MWEVLMPVATFLTQFFSEKLLEWGLEIGGDYIRFERTKEKIRSKIHYVLQNTIKDSSDGPYIIENFDLEAFFQDRNVQEELSLLLQPSSEHQPNVTALQEVWKQKLGGQLPGNYQLILIRFLRELKQGLWEIPEIQSLLHIKEDRVFQKDTRNAFSDLSAKFDSLTQGEKGNQEQIAIAHFSRQTLKSLVTISREIPGISGSIRRKEISIIEDQLDVGCPIVLIGDAGTGKSGIGAEIAYAFIQDEKQVLFIDARKMSGLKTDKELSDCFYLNELISDVISRLKEYSRFRLIIDQLDNVAGLPSANLLIDLATECSKMKNVEVVIVSRDFDVDGEELLQNLKDKGFCVVESQKLTKEEVVTLLTQLGVHEYPDVVELAQNLLNLKIIGKIKEEVSDFDFSTILDEVVLWNTYLDILVKEETQNYGSRQGKKIVQEAIRLACESLKHDQRIFPLPFSLTDEQERLRSWGILREESLGQYRFQHEKMHDFFYALYATREQLMPLRVIQELGLRNAKNVFPFMDSLYEKGNSSLHLKFFKEIMYVQ